MKMYVKTVVALAAFLMVAVISFVLFLSGDSSASSGYTTTGDTGLENFKFVKNIMIWFMLMLVAFLMLFIKKYEWGVALAVLLSAAGSFVVYLAIKQFLFGVSIEEAWNQDLMLMGVICAITVVIAIGCFLGKLKMWQYFVAGILFAPVFLIVEWFLFGIGLEHEGLLHMVFGFNASDAGGSMLVHMCAAYFGLGVAIALREKRAFNEPMYTTTHSVSFVWLASMLLWVLWPSFVTALLPADQVFWGMMVCYLAGIGSIISAWIVCTAIQKKVNPLIYTYAMLAGPVAIGAPLLMIGPWAALVIGLIAGVISALSFIYLHPRLTKAIGALDVMGVHNLHGVAGWFGAIVAVIAIPLYGIDGADSLTNLVGAIGVFAISIALGIVIGFVLKLTRGKFPDEHMFSDDADFIKSEKPAE
ncbi:Ammonium transporter [Candidatus Methanoplasma termitum]|uniref:Ammonium transporter n=1 Tax=Candidatus Methanoplasma termitum TaxID=1577791 RepID=A0A0A7LBM0_9ARCH|nr:ammonium transporter [Candidatus Methanoplasma termitum]AIZ56464.1 Ammonium transporter [Candidatus Methanoplasma termitum]